MQNLIYAQVLTTSIMIFMQLMQESLKMILQEKQNGHHPILGTKRKQDLNNPISPYPSEPEYKLGLTIIGEQDYRENTSCLSIKNKRVLFRLRCVLCSVWVEVQNVLCRLFNIQTVRLIGLQNELLKRELKCRLWWKVMFVIYSITFILRLIRM